MNINHSNKQFKVKWINETKKFSANLGNTLTPTQVIF